MRYSREVAERERERERDRQGEEEREMRGRSWGCDTKERRDTKKAEEKQEE